MVVTGSEVGVDRALVCWQLHSPEASLWLEASKDAVAALATGALRVEDPSGPLAQAIGVACLSDLMTTLWGGPSEGAPQPCSAPGDECRNPRYGGLEFSVTGLPIEIRVLTDRGWCESVVPFESWPRPALTHRRQAIGATRVSLKATVELGEIPLLDSMDWRLGELLVTDATPIQSVSLMLADKPVRTGVLSKHPSARALAIS